MQKIFTTLLLGFCLTLGACSSLGLGSDPGERSARQVVDDASITTSVKSKFLADKYIKGLTVDVDTFQRVVTLSGVVNSNFTREHAEEIAANTRGVAKVVNNLQVAGS
ncbi:MAG: BON domain-containing protein [Gammaproteobacteria bacterium]|nr:BON domain-containing protein [Gammaproteobacteria bacterium]NNM14381.1 BON domain-containing protein [Gammaproteobacteria bacterium]